MPLYVSARGLTTSPIPYGAELFEIEFDFVDHRLLADHELGADALDAAAARAAWPTSTPTSWPRSSSWASTCESATMPVEVPEPIRFERRPRPRQLRPGCAHAFWRVLVRVDRVFKVFRGRFLGKCSPVHFFWGGFDLAVTRFSGRRAPMWAARR